MIQNFRVLNVKDTESPVESLIISNSPVSNIGTLNFNIPSSIISKEQESTDTFDTFLEKRKNKKSN